MTLSAPKIGLYQPYPHSFGGLQAVVIKLARALPDFGFQPVIISPEAGQFTERLHSENLPLIVSDPGEDWHVYGRGANGLSYLASPKRIVSLLRYWRKLSRDLREHSIALLHCNDYRAVMLAAPAARLAGIPVIWHMHGFVPSRLANLVASALVQWTVPVSQGMLDYLGSVRRFFGKCQVIHNGLETDSDNLFASPWDNRRHQLPPHDSKIKRTASPLTPALSPLRGEGDSAPLVLAVGTLHPRKGYETLLRAFHEVLSRCPEAECWIVGGEFGDGSYARRLREMAANLGLEGKVKFPGHSAAVQDDLRRSSLLVIPSRVEAFGMVAIEAMQAGKPVVACRTGGLSDIVVHGKTGLLVEMDDHLGMAAAIVNLLKNQCLSRSMGTAGRLRVQEHFTVRKMTASFADFYTGLLREAA